VHVYSNAVGEEASCHQAITAKQQDRLQRDSEWRRDCRQERQEVHQRLTRDPTVHDRVGKQQAKRSTKTGAEKHHTHRVVEDATIIARVAGINIAVKLFETELSLGSKAPLHNDASKRPDDEGEHEGTDHEHPSQEHRVLRQQVQLMVTAPERWHALPLPCQSASYRVAAISLVNLSMKAFLFLPAYAKL